MSGSRLGDQAWSNARESCEESSVEQVGVASGSGGESEGEEERRRCESRKSEDRDFEGGGESGETVGRR